MSKIGINGFGRIGRLVLRRLLETQDSNTVVAGSRFQPGSQPFAYRALGVADAPSRATREEALADWLAHHRETAT